MRKRFGTAVAGAAMTVAAFAVAAGPARAASISLVLGTSPTASAIQSYSWGITNSTTIGSGTGGAGTGKAEFGEFKLTKQVDGNSLKLFEAAAKGTHLDTVVVQFNNSPFTSAYCLSPVFVTSVQQAATTVHPRPTEQVTLVFGRMTEKIGTSFFTWDSIANTEPPSSLCPA